MVFVLTQQIIVDGEVRQDTIVVVSRPCQVSNSHRIAKCLNIAKLGTGWISHTRDRIHDEIFIRILAKGILPVDAHVRRYALRNTQQITVVLIVVIISEGKVGREPDAVAYKIIECHAGGKLIERLLDDCTRLVFIACRYTEHRLLATTTDIEIIIVGLRKLGNSLHPVGIVVPVLIISPVLIIVYLVDVGRGITYLPWVIQLFLQQHGIIITVEKLIA